MFNGLINLLYPPSCQICGKKILLPLQNLCETCLKKIKRRLPPFCIKCGKCLSGEPQLQATCNDCKKDNIYFDRALSVFRYNDALKNLIHNFKYKKMTLMANEFAEWVVDFMKEYKIGIDTDIVLSIPMHPIKLFEREINPSHILAKNIAKKLALRYSERLIKKIKNTPPQSKLPRTQRLKNVKFSFCLDKNKESEVRNKRILLVDDLFTTGSTVNECARLLKELDVGYIEVITLARGDAFL